jgi:general secretion pathway protein M
MLSTPWVRRLVAIMLLPLVAAAIYVLIIDPVMIAYTETGTRIAEYRDQLAHLKRVAAMRPALVEQVTAFEQREDMDGLGLYLSGGTDALAAVALQDRLKDVVGEGGGVRSVQPLPGADEHGFRRVTVRVQMTATTASLFRVLYALEAGRPIVFVDNIIVQNRAAPVTDQDASAPPVEDPALAVAFDLYGYLPAVAP